MAALKQIPEHLTPFIAEQKPELYTAIDHAVWRYILRIARSFFRDHAHQKYLDGLKETGISTERIPLIPEMDECLKRFGWRAVAVAGFIPPAVFMEFQSLGVLPIACDMRKHEHLGYTPAPDIVHEAAGHAPIIADPEYAAYLKAYGEVARKAIFSDKDMEVYEAIRDLSDIKEDPESTSARIQEAQNRLDAAVANNTYVSEASYLARMNWWTVEYGLIGEMSDPKIYGAGLLSSVGESTNCLTDAVRKLPFTLDCVNMNYDITRPQPQLYVTRDFQELTEALDEFAEGMAFKKGGIEGLVKAKTARTVTTSLYDSGLQVSGILDDFLITGEGEPCYLRFRGPCQLAFGDRELDGHDPSRHPEGFGAPVGRLPDGTSAADRTFKVGSRERVEFASGVVVDGEVTAVVQEAGRNLLVTFTDCNVSRGDEVLFEPQWGEFDMACGTAIMSVFGGAADRGAYVRATGGYTQREPVHKTNLTDQNRELVSLYARVRELREEEPGAGTLVAALGEVYEKLSGFPEDWLLRMELLELVRERGLKADWADRARKEVRRIAEASPENKDLIERGLALLENGRQAA